MERLTDEQIIELVVNRAKEDLSFLKRLNKTAIKQRVLSETRSSRTEETRFLWIRCFLKTRKLFRMAKNSLKYGAAICRCSISIWISFKRTKTECKRENLFIFRSKRQNQIHIGRKRECFVRSVIAIM